MNNPYLYQTDVGGYNSEVNSIINQRADRLAAIRGGMEYKRDSKVAALEDKSRGLESSAREWLEGGIGGALGAKEMISGFPNVRKGYTSLKKGVNFVKRKFNEYKANQTNQADDTANEEQPVQEDETQSPVEEQEPPSRSGDVEMTEPSGDTGGNTVGDTVEETRSPYGGDFEDTNSSPFTRSIEQDPETSARRLQTSASEETDATTDDITDDVVDDALKNIGSDVAEDSVLDFLPGIGWLVAAGMATAGIVEEVNKAQAAERATEEAAKVRKQVINPTIAPVNFSGSYVAPVKATVY